MLDREVDPVAQCQLDQIRDAVLKNTGTALKMPEMFGDDLFDDGNLADQLWDLLLNLEGVMATRFLEDAVERMKSRQVAGRCFINAKFTCIT